MNVPNIAVLLLPILLLSCKSTTSPARDQRVYLFDTSYYTEGVFGKAFHRLIEQVEVSGVELRFARFEIDSSRGDAIDTNAIYFDRMGYLEVGSSEIKFDTIIFIPEFISVERDSGEKKMDLNGSKRIRIDGKGIPQRYIVSSNEKSVSILQSDSTVFRVYSRNEGRNSEFGILNQMSR